MMYVKNRHKRLEYLYVRAHLGSGPTVLYCKITCRPTSITSRSLMKLAPTRITVSKFTMVSDLTGVAALGAPLDTPAF
jgi:hypothetical protein